MIGVDRHRFRSVVLVHTGKHLLADRFEVLVDLAVTVVIETILEVFVDLRRVGWIPGVVVVIGGLGAQESHSDPAGLTLIGFADRPKRPPLGEKFEVAVVGLGDVGLGIGTYRADPKSRLVEVLPPSPAGS